MPHQETSSPRNHNVQYPLDPKSYLILDEIGQGVSAIVYRAICVPVNSTTVAIKAIDLDRSRANLDSVRREAKTMSLLSHPNILKAHCSFTVDRRLWVVMPFMSGGSLQSIVSSSFPDGLSEPCIAAVLKETLAALSYLHDQGHLHRDIKAGNILIDSNGNVKLADFGVSASIYEPSGGSSMLTDIAGTPYWMAPEVIHSHTGYSLKADIWSFGITALELAHGRPPLSHLPPSKSLIVKITKRFRVSDYEGSGGSNGKKFSKGFKDMVGLCLDQDPSRRPSAEKLLKHSFFKNCKGSDYLVKNVLQGLPSVEQRFSEIKLRSLPSMKRTEEEEDEDHEGDLLGEIVKRRRVSGWNFNVDGFELDPVFPTEKEIDEIVKQVRFGGETVIPDKQQRGGSGVLDNWPSTRNVDEAQLGGGGSDEAESGGAMGEVIGGGEAEIGVGYDKQVVVAGLMYLRKSLEEQKEAVTNMIGLFRGEESVEEMSREEKLMQVIENMKAEFESEKKKNLELEMELEFLKLQISNAS